MRGKTAKYIHGLHNRWRVKLKKTQKYHLKANFMHWECLCWLFFFITFCKTNNNLQTESIASKSVSSTISAEGMFFPKRSNTAFPTGGKLSYKEQTRETAIYTGEQLNFRYLWPAGTAACGANNLSFNADTFDQAQQNQGNGITQNTHAEAKFAGAGILHTGVDQTSTPIWTLWPSVSWIESGKSG